MENCTGKKGYSGKVKAVVLDWAGTAVDHGCMGPAAVFVEVFKSHGIGVSLEEARQFMGIEKKEHIEKICSLSRVGQAWKEKHGRLPNGADVDKLYEMTSTLMVKAIAGHADPIPGVVETAKKLRSMGIKIGSSTGYVKEMMDVLVPLAKEKGYSPDAVVCSSDVPKGRPYPWMCYENAVSLNVYPMSAMVKIGDTIADIEEGRNAGMWTVGITRTGNELGMSLDGVENMDSKVLAANLKKINARFSQAGAHYVLEQVADVIPVIEKINQRLQKGEHPLA